MKTICLLVAVFCIPACPAMAQTDGFKAPEFKFPDTVKSFDWKAISSVSASGDGAGGVLFLSDKKGNKVVLKFEGEDAAAFVYADFVMTTLKIPNPDSTVLRRHDPAVSNPAKLSYDLIVKKIETLAEETPLASDQRFKEVFGRHETAGALILMRRVRASGESWNLAEVLDGTATGTASLNPQKLLAVALNDRDQARVLGRLIVADTVLGNGDRFFGGRIANAGNLMLSSKAQFIAIDNFSDMSSMKEVAWWKLTGRIVDQFQGRTPQELQEEYELSTSQYVTALVNGFDRNGNPTPELDQAVKPDEIAAAATDSLKAQFEEMIKSLPETSKQAIDPVDWDAFTTNFKLGMTEAFSQIIKKKSEIRKPLTDSGADVLEIKMRYLQNFDPLDRGGSIQKAMGSKKDVTAKYKFQLSVKRDADENLIVTKKDNPIVTKKPAK